MNSKERQLMKDVPLMRCGNRVEFQQRLEWLSEGMLRNHLESVINYVPSVEEMEIYKLFKEKS